MDIEAIEARLNQARADLAATQAAFARAEEDLRSATTTVLSADRAVEVTVGPQGELTGLKFLDGKYRNMGAAQLAASVLEAAERGRAEMARRVMDTFQPIAEGMRMPEAQVPGAEARKIDWEGIFGPLITAAAPTYTRPSASDRLRDEIHEDTEERNG